MSNFKATEEAKKAILKRIASKLAEADTKNEVSAQPLRHGAHGSTHASSHSSIATRAHGACIYRHGNRH